MQLMRGLGIRPGSGRPAIVSFVGGGGKSSAAFRLARELAAAGGRAVVTTTTRMAEAQIGEAPALVRAGAGGWAALEDALRGALDRHGWCLLLGEPRADDVRQGKATGVAPALVDEIARRGGALGPATVVVEADGSRMLPAKAPGAHEPALPSSTTVAVAVLGLDAVGAEIDEANVHRAGLARRLLGEPVDAPARLTPEQAARLLVHPEGGRKAVPAGARFSVLLNKAEGAARLACGRLVADRLRERGAPALVAALHGEEPVRERWGPVAAVVLAAGGAKRFGATKQAAVVEGAPMVVQAVGRALASEVDRVVVVTGAEAARVEALLQPFAGGGRVQIVRNDGWAAGQASSIRRGLGALAEDICAALFLPADQPFVEARLLDRLTALWRGGAELCAAAVEGEMRGAPALFDRSVWPELMALEGDVGGRAVLRKHSGEVALAPAEAAWLVDIDTPDELNAWRVKGNKR